MLKISTSHNNTIAHSEKLTIIITFGHRGGDDERYDNVDYDTPEFDVEKEDASVNDLFDETKI